MQVEDKLFPTCEYSWGELHSSSTGMTGTWCQRSAGASEKVWSWAFSPDTCGWSSSCAMHWPSGMALVWWWTLWSTHQARYCRYHTDKTCISVLFWFIITAADRLAQKPMVKLFLLIRAAFSCWIWASGLICDWKILQASWCFISYKHSLNSPFPLFGFYHIHRQSSE